VHLCTTVHYSFISQVQVVLLFLLDATYSSGLFSLQFLCFGLLCRLFAFSTTVLLHHVAKVGKSIIVVSCGGLVVPCSRTMRYGQRCFAVSGPILWNSLPLSVRDLSLTSTQFCVLLRLCY